MASEELKLSQQRLVAVLTCLVLLIGSTALCSRLSFSDWRTATLSMVLTLAVMIGFCLNNRDALLARLLGFGLVLGIFELTGDAYLVAAAKTLDYSIDRGGPRLWCSPIYMPIAWQVVSIQFAVLGTAMQDRWGRIGILLTGLLGGASIPIYDELAYNAHWWRWVHCRMFNHVSYHVILGYFLMALLIAYAAPFLRSTHRPWLRAIVIGALLGLATVPICALAYRITG